MDKLELMLWTFTVYYCSGLVITSFIVLRGMDSGELPTRSTPSAVVALLVTSCVAPLVVLSAVVGGLVRTLRGK